MIRTDRHRRVVSKRRLWLGCVAVALLTLVSGGVTVAHQPWFNLEGSPDSDQPYRLQSEIEVSQVVFADLAAAGRVDYYAFTAPAGFALDLHLVVPDAPACAAFQPAFALIGPGLTGATGDMAPAATPRPASVPTAVAGSGTTTIAGDEWRQFAHAGIAYLVGPAFAGRLAGGDYLVAVYDPSGETGAYGLSLGGAERFSLPPPEFATNMARWSACESGSPTG